MQFTVRVAIGKWDKKRKWDKKVGIGLHYHDDTKLWIYIDIGIPDAASDALDNWPPRPLCVRVG